jgi:hypothetical protein
MLWWWWGGGTGGESTLVPGTYTELFADGPIGRVLKALGFQGYECTIEELELVAGASATATIAIATLGMAPESPGQLFASTPDLATGVVLRSIVITAPNTVALVFQNITSGPVTQPAQELSLLRVLPINDV